jgi:hypothetical protein
VPARAAPCCAGLSKAAARPWAYGLW